MNSVRGCARLTAAVLLSLSFVRGAEAGSAASPLPGSLEARGPQPWLTAAADFNLDGFTDLVVISRGGQLTSWLGGPQGRLAEAGNGAPVGPGPRAVVAKDMNGDGRPDLIVANSESVQIFYNPAQGGQFFFAGFYLSGAANGLAAGDLDSDGFTDVVTSVPGNGIVKVYFSTRIGPLNPPLQLPPSVGILSLALADFNGDGRPDIVSLNACSAPTVCGQGSVSVYINDGGRRFQPPRQSSALGGYPVAMAIGDFNEDGRVDIAATVSTDEVLVLPGRGDGTFADALRRPGGTQVGGLVAGDLNLDGHLDLAVTGMRAGGPPVPDGELALLTGRGDGTFQDPSVLGAGTLVGSPLIGDFNGDAFPDLAVPTSGDDFFFFPEPAGGVLIYPGDGTGRFGDQQSLPVFEIRDAISADLDGDGRKELILSSGKIFGLGTDGRYGPRTPLAEGLAPTGGAAADVDGDGRLDLILPTGRSEILVLLGVGDGTFSAPTSVSIQGATRRVIAADFNHDGMADVAVVHDDPVSNFSPQHISVLLARGGGTLEFSDLYSPCTPTEVVVADYYADGNPDLGVLCGDGFQVMPGMGDGTFITWAKTEMRSSNVEAADVDGDGLVDLVTAAGTDYVILRTFLGRGDGTFGAPLEDFIFSYRDGVATLAAADFNNDGRVDLAVGLNRLQPQFQGSSPGPATTVVFNGRGDGRFDQGETLFGSQSPLVMLADDLDGDGRQDLTVVSGGSKPMTVSLNTGPVSDADHDGLLNKDDPCTDTDGDGFGDPEFRNACASDNCPAVPNPSQTDADSDGLGDACDRCTDADGDEVGNAGFPLNICPSDDNCPSVPNVRQDDDDHDGLGNACDPCTDIDGDGLGGYPTDVCGLDNCPGMANPDQSNQDGDYYGDVCDPCPFDPLNDVDGDRVCGDVDTCPFLDAPQTDVDGDRVGDACDNCPNAANADQADGNADGAGDACQPSLVLSGITSGGSGGLIEVAVTARDPQGETLSGTIEISETTDQPLDLADLMTTRDCRQGWFPEGRVNEGIGFVYGSFGSPLLVDFQTLADFAQMNCGPRGEVSWLIGEGDCSEAVSFSSVFELTGRPLPLRVCAVRSSVPDASFDATVESFDQQSVRITVKAPRLLTYPFTDGLPGSIPIDSLTVGDGKHLKITVTDGNTPPVSVESSFEYQGETRMVFGSRGTAPAPVIAPVTPAECVGGGGTVTLDASASTDPDSTPGTNDDIVQFEWIEGYGTPTETLLSTDEVANVALPLGNHDVTLQVTDSTGHSATAHMIMQVVDTLPPAVTVSVQPSILWPPNHRMVEVQMVVQAVDACDVSACVGFGTVTSSEPDDAPGGGDGSTTGDIAQARGSLCRPGPLFLRAERSADGPGRVYTIEIPATDRTGNTSVGVATVTVPHDLGAGPEPIEQRLQSLGQSARIQTTWSAVADAGSYDLIRGRLESVAVRDARVSLGSVRLLSTGGTGTIWAEVAGDDRPAVGRAFFYLVQYRNAQGGSGYGTESSPLPMEPDGIVTDAVLADERTLRR